MHQQVVEVRHGLGIPHRVTNVFLRCGVGAARLSAQQIDWSKKETSEDCAYYYAKAPRLTLVPAQTLGRWIVHPVDYRAAVFGEARQNRREPKQQTDAHDVEHQA